MIPAQFDYVRPVGHARRAADPGRARGRGQGPVGRLQPPAADQAPARPAGPARRHPGHRRPRRDRRDRRRPAHRRPGHPPPDPRGPDGPRRLPAPDRRGRPGSAIRRSATGARSAARAPTPTRRRTGRRSCSPPGPASSAAAAAGERTIAAADFFIDTFQTAIEPTELLTEIRIPRWAKGSGGAYAKLERRAGDFSTVGCAAMVCARARRRDRRRRDRADRGRRDARSRSNGAQAALVGAQPSEATFRAAGAAAAAESRPATDASRPGRVQAGDGRGDDRPGPAQRRRARARRSDRSER